MRYQPRDSNIVWEITDGEILLVDLFSGAYFSVREGSVQLASDVLLGFNSEEILERWLSRFSHPPRPEVEKELEKIVELLKTNDLITARASDDIPQAPLPELVGDKIVPIEKFEDMQEIFEMDPIHEVDNEHGWPVLS